MLSACQRFSAAGVESYCPRILESLRLIIAGAASQDISGCYEPHLVGNRNFVTVMNITAACATVSPIRVRLTGDSLALYVLQLRAHP